MKENYYNDFIRKYFAKAYENLEDAKILAANKRWNACMNSMYFSSYYSVCAIMTKIGFEIRTHHGVKSKFFLDFIKTGQVDKDLGRLYADLFFNWQQENEFNEFINLDEARVLPMLSQISDFIDVLQNKVGDLVQR